MAWRPPWSNDMLAVADLLPSAIGPHLPNGEGRTRPPSRSRTPCCSPSGTCSPTASSSKTRCRVPRAPSRSLARRSDSHGGSRHSGSMSASPGRLLSPRAVRQPQSFTADQRLVARPLRYRGHFTLGRRVSFVQPTGGWPCACHQCTSPSAIPAAATMSPQTKLTKALAAAPRTWPSSSSRTVSKLHVEKVV